MKYLRYKYLPLGTVHRVTKLNNGKPWSHTECGAMVVPGKYVPTKDAVTCAECLAKKEPIVYIGEGIGCLLLCIGAAIIIWALSGFPGLVQ